MNTFHAILLGIIQGLTEFIPVSSTAHLLIAEKLLGIPADDAMFSFLVIVQLGTLVSLFIFYWKDLLGIVRAIVDFRSLRDFGSLLADLSFPKPHSCQQIILANELMVHGCTEVQEDQP